MAAEAARAVAAAAVVADKLYHLAAARQHLVHFQQLAAPEGPLLMHRAPRLPVREQLPSASSLGCGTWAWQRASREVRSEKCRVAAWCGTAARGSRYGVFPRSRALWCRAPRRAHRASRARRKLMRRVFMSIAAPRTCSGEASSSEDNERRRDFAVGQQEQEQQQQQQQQRSDENGVGRPACSVRVGTVDGLIAQGPAPPCAACTLATGDKAPSAPQLFGRGWVALCTTHKTLAQAEQNRSFSAPPLPLPTSSRGQPPPVTSISARWRQQTSMKKQQHKKKERLKNAALRASVGAAGGSETASDARQST